MSNTINYVKFLRGNPAAFEKLKGSEDRNTLYFISEDGAKEGKLYLGDKLIAGGTNLSKSSISELEDILINEEGLVDGSILVYDIDQQQWVNKTVGEVIADIMTGATAEAAGKSGLVPAPAAGQNGLFLRGDGTWAQPTLSSEDQEKVSSLQDQIDSLVSGQTNADGSPKSIEEIALATLTEALIPENASESLDTLKEIADWIQAHPEDASWMSESIIALQDLTSEFDETLNGTNGLVDRTEAIENILNDTTDKEGNTVKGLITKVNELSVPDDTYVLKTVYTAQVGDLSQLKFSKDSNSTIVDEINSINERLTWVDIN